MIYYLLTLRGDESLATFFLPKFVANQEKINKTDEKEGREEPALLSLPCLKCYLDLCWDSVAGAMDGLLLASALCHATNFESDGREKLLCGEAKSPIS
jgi:hypothetical protein